MATDELTAPLIATVGLAASGATVELHTAGIASKGDQEPMLGLLAAATISETSAAASDTPGTVAGPSLLGELRATGGGSGGGRFTHGRRSGETGVAV